MNWWFFKFWSKYKKIWITRLRLTYTKTHYHQINSNLVYYLKEYLFFYHKSVAKNDLLLVWQWLYQWYRSFILIPFLVGNCHFDFDLLTVVCSSLCLFSLIRYVPTILTYQVWSECCLHSTIGSHHCTVSFWLAMQAGACFGGWSLQFCQALFGLDLEAWVFGHQSGKPCRNALKTHIWKEL